MNMEFAFFLNFSERGEVEPHEYPPSSYKHVRVVGGERTDHIMRRGSESG